MKTTVTVYKPDLKDETREIESEASSDVKRLVLYSIMRLYKEEEIQGIEFKSGEKTHFLTSRQIFHGEK